MKVIGFSGSPRKNGNTVWIIEQIMKKTRQISNSDTLIFKSSDMDIKPCRGCFYCKNNNSMCVIKDDMQKIYVELNNANALIFATPIYMGQITGQAKVFLDRLFPVNSPKFSPYYKKQSSKKKILLIFTQGNPDATKFQPYVSYIKKTFEILDYDVKEPIIIAGTRSLDVRNMKDIDELLFKTCLNLFN